MFSLNSSLTTASVSFIIIIIIILFYSMIKVEVNKIMDDRLWIKKVKMDCEKFLFDALILIEDILESWMLQRRMSVQEALSS